MLSFMIYEAQIIINVNSMIYVLEEPRLIYVLFTNFIVLINCYQCRFYIFLCNHRRTYRMEKDFNELEIQSQKRSEYEIHLSNLLCAHISNTSKYPVKT